MKFYNIISKVLLDKGNSWDKYLHHAPMVDVVGAITFNILLETQKLIDPTSQ